MIFSGILGFFNNLLATASMLLPHSGEQPKGFVPPATEISAKKSGDQQRISGKGGDSTSAASRNKVATKSKTTDLVARGSSPAQHPAQAEGQTPRMSSETGDVSARPIDNGERQSSQAPRPRSSHSGDVSAPPQGESSSQPATMSGSEGGGSASPSSHGGGGGGGSSSPEEKEGSYLTPEQVDEYQKLREQASNTSLSSNGNLNDDLKGASGQPSFPSTKDSSNQPVFDDKNPSSEVGNSERVQQKSTPSSRTSKSLVSSNSSQRTNESSSTESSLNQLEPTEVHENSPSQNTSPEIPSTTLVADRVEAERLPQTELHPATQNVGNARSLPTESSSPAGSSLRLTSDDLIKPLMFVSPSKLTVGQKLPNRMPVDLENALMTASPAKLTSVFKKTTETPLVTASPTKPTVKPSSPSSSTATSKEEELGPVMDIKISEEVTAAAQALGFYLNKSFKILDEAVEELTKKSRIASYNAQKKLESIDPDKDESSMQEYIRLSQESDKLLEAENALKKFLQTRYAPPKKSINKGTGGGLMDAISKQGQEDTPQTPEQTTQEMEEELIEIKQALINVDKQMEFAFKNDELDEDEIRFLVKQLKTQQAEMKEKEIALRNRLVLHSKQASKKNVQVVDNSSKRQELFEKQQKAAQEERKYFEANYPELLPFLDLFDINDQIKLRKLNVNVYYSAEGKQIVEPSSNPKMLPQSRNHSVVETLMKLDDDKRQEFLKFISGLLSVDRLTGIKRAKYYFDYAGYTFPPLPKKQKSAKVKDVEKPKEPEEEISVSKVKNSFVNSPMKPSRPDLKKGKTVSHKGSLKTDHSSVSGKQDDEDLNN